jgi:pyruvate kinase
MKTDPSQATLPQLWKQVESIRTATKRGAEQILKNWARKMPGPEGLPENAGNLAAYLALRHQDLRELQDELSHRGLSSLGRCESRVMASLDAVLAMLARAGAHDREPPQWPAPESFTAGFQRIQETAGLILGPSNASKVRIMVTLPAKAADDPAWCRSLIEAGASCVRINCAHDTPEQWLAMIRHVRAAARSLKREVRVLMDLAGPRARTTEFRLSSTGQQRAKNGDHIFLAHRKLPGQPQAPFEAVCSLPEVVKALKRGTYVFFNEGKLGAAVLKTSKEGVLMVVTQARAKGERFREDMAINVLGADLKLEALTARDREHLDFVMKHADIAGYSFVQRAEDMEVLHEEIARRTPLREIKRPLAVVAKIETALAVRNLPDIIMHGLARAPLAVMIARGDLAVELGPVRMAEIQEELLWISEAAHVPVIWATQVLESLAKKGLASRAELTDAAMSERAECVMLNKGPYILETVRVLNEVLTRMAGHQRKKMPTFRPLRSWAHLLES